MLNYIEGDILDVESGIICHQVNCKGAFGAGLAKQIAKKYPEAKEDYEKFVSKHVLFRGELLSKVKFTYINSNLSIAHLFAQNNYGSLAKLGKVHTDYDAFEKCIKEVVRSSVDSEIYVPYGIGCGLAGGNWSKVESILKSLDKDINVVKLK